ncbi:MAG: NAD(P)-dependent oxidoreductase [Faecalibacillus sp.]
MKKIFLCEDIHPKAYQLLKDNFEIINDIKYIGQADALLIRNLKIQQDIIDQCFHLKLVAIHGTGYDHIDLDYLKEKGITVFCVPGENALSVSELIVTLILALSRKILFSQKLLKEGNCQSGTQLLTGQEISNKTIGFIGFGCIAKKTAKILYNGFSMKICAYSPHLKQNETDIEVCQNIEEVFKKADIVSINCTFNEKTKHIITLDVLKHAKKNCLLINTARGAVVCENDLYYALSHHIIAGAACDVFNDESNISQNKLLLLDNFIATPHIGATTEEALYRVGMKAVQGIIAFFQGKSVDHQI